MTTTGTVTRPVATLLLSTTSVALAVSFSRVFEAGEYLPGLVSVALVAHLIAFVMRHRPVPTLAALVVQLVSVYVFNAWIHVRDTLWFGLPLGRTWTEVSARVGESADLLGDVTPPLAFATGFGFIAGLAVGAAAVLADAFAFRAAGRGEALVPSAVVFAVAAIVGEDRHRLLVTAVWLTTAIVVVATLRRSDGSTPARESRALPSTLALAVTIAVVSAWIGPRLPGADADALIGRDTDSGRVVEPLVDVRGRLGDRSDTVLFRVVSDRPAYWRLTSLAEFDGSTWGITDEELDDAGGRLAVGADPTSAWFVIQTVTIENLRGNMAPAAHEATELRAASRSLYYELESGTLLVSGSDLAPSNSYTIVSAVADPPPFVLDSASSLSPPSARYLSVPDNDEMRELGDIARDITAGSATGYQAAMDLQNFFRVNFTYSLDVPAIDGEDAYLDFIERGSGYCEQFASTFAAMARAIGLPARVAIGFTPGESDGQGSYTVRSQHAHAWPEVWFDGLGWLMFEPTPGRGAPDRGYTGVEPQQDESTPAPATTTVAPTTTTAVAPSTTGSPDATPTTLPGPSTDDVVPAPTDPGPSGLTLALVILVSAVLAWPVVVRLLVTRAARTTTAPPLLVLWRRLLAEEGFTRRSDLTPSEIARTLNRTTDDDDVADRLALAVERLLFAERPPSPDEMETLTNAVEARVRIRRADKTLPRRERLMRHVSPSLARRLAGLHSAEEI